jgi:hypothetical protein
LKTQTYPSSLRDSKKYFQARDREISIEEAVNRRFLEKLVSEGLVEASDIHGHEVPHATPDRQYVVLEEREEMVPFHCIQGTIR